MAQAMVKQLVAAYGQSNGYGQTPPMVKTMAKAMPMLRMVQPMLVQAMNTTIKAIITMINRMRRTTITMLHPVLLPPLQAEIMRIIQGNWTNLD